jgi:hypothetical protein
VLIPCDQLQLTGSIPAGVTFCLLAGKRRRHCPDGSLRPDSLPCARISAELRKKEQLNFKLPAIFGSEIAPTRDALAQSRCGKIHMGKELQRSNSLALFFSIQKPFSGD